MIPLNITAAPVNLPFDIIGCAEYTMNMAQTLTQALESIAPALQDAALDHKSPIFNAMFKDGSASTKTFVHKILKNIASGAGALNLQPYPKIPTAPSFVCVTPYTTDLSKMIGLDLWGLCTQPAAGQAYYVHEFPYIFLCPSFWRIPMAPSFPDCPSVRRNRWEGFGQGLANYASYLLIHEMVHFYLGESSTGGGTQPPEAYLINDCVGLSAYLSRHNPQNYQNYVACTDRPLSQIPTFRNLADVRQWLINDARMLQIPENHHYYSDQVI